MTLPPYAWLALAIVAEVAGTTALALSDGMTRWRPAAVVVVAYGLSFWLFSFTLKTIPAGVAYAVWSGAGIVMLAVIGRVWLGQRLDAPAYIGIALILAGVLVINLLSKSERL